MNTNTIKDSYVLDGEHLAISQNSQDIYVTLKTDWGKDFMIPIFMPRRNPSLNFDLSNPDDSFWEYLSNCKDELEEDKVTTWIELQKTNLQNSQSESQKKMLLVSLLENLNVCYKCFAQDNHSPNPQKLIQYLRDDGYIICTHKSFCEKCNSSQTIYSLTPILKGTSQLYENIPKRLKERIIKVLDYTDSYTGIKNTGITAHIPDHKFPEDRWDNDTPTDNNNLSDEDIRNKFQLLNPQTNMQKQRFCSNCIRSNKRGYPFGIKYYYSGAENWDESIPAKGKDAEKGCYGCGWYDIAEWRRSLNNYLSNKKD